MRLITSFIFLLFMVQYFFSLKYGYDYKTGCWTLLFTATINPLLYFIGKFNNEVLIVSRITFYAIAGAVVTLCFHPLLDFYSLKSSSYSLLDWAASNDSKIIISEEKAWYGMWYAKLLLAGFGSLVAMTMHQLFEDD
ncbi:hypothetical protein MMP65_19170 [Acinetobacter sp. ANC 3926]|uniref:hypothetical protein n=1 Tax=Acinetobacter genomosp. 15BJ TaxID=106651 RepID=UPI001F4A5B42|nr:hypothetical protein [Acinetobacter genomosp. 15BJ]MCH7293561.1 hypothetical protein [Acinetobacter genomosp. 15BJ]